jgi:hypothetical protein
MPRQICLQAILLNLLDEQLKGRPSLSGKSQLYTKDYLCASTLKQLNTSPFSYSLMPTMETILLPPKITPNQF